MANGIVTDGQALQKKIPRDKHLRGISEKSWNAVNKIRIERGYTWAELIDHLANYSSQLRTMMAHELRPSLPTIKSRQTLSALLPRWGSNIRQNMQDIIEHGDIACLVCKTRKENHCPRLEKFKEMALDPTKEYTEADVAKLAGLPIESANYFLRVVYTYDFVPVAGSYVCVGCENRTSADKPALIVAGGPSLETYHHLDLLKEHGFEGDIFCAAKTAKSLLEHGIVPKYVGSLDAAQYDTTFFESPIMQEHSKDMIGLFGTNVHPTTPKSFKGNRYYFTGYISESEGPNMSHMIHLITQTSTLSAVGNIGSCLCNAAAVFGYNPLVIIGLDLSFPTKRDMQDYYPLATDDDWNKPLDYGDGKLRPMYKRGQNPDFNKQYYMDTVFESYKLSHLTWAKTLWLQNHFTINCTEQGALHADYIQSIPFEEYLLHPDKYSVEELTKWKKQKAEDSKTKIENNRTGKSKSKNKSGHLLDIAESE